MLLMKHKTCLITGGTSGVGKAIAIGLATQGAQVILLCRDRKKGAESADFIKRKTNNNLIHVMTANLASLDSIRFFCNDFKKQYKQLHVLSNNAAVFPMQRETTEDGFESIFGVNYLGHFYLTYLLTELLAQSAPSRIITVSGSPGLLKNGKINLLDLQSEQSFNPFKATLQAAMAKVVFSHELADRLKNMGVTSNTFHPGLVKSRLGRRFPVVFRPLIFLGELFLREKCETGVYLASSPAVSSISGAIFLKKQPVSFKSHYLDSSFLKKLWEESEKICGLPFR